VVQGEGPLVSNRGAVTAIRQHIPRCIQLSEVGEAHAYRLYLSLSFSTANSYALPSQLLMSFNDFTTADARSLYPPFHKIFLDGPAQCYPVSTYRTPVRTRAVINFFEN